MRIPGIGEQSNLIPRFRADGIIAAGGTPQLVLPRAAPRSSWVIQNKATSTGVLTIEYGCARATATISGGVVTGCTVTNAGFGFAYAPLIEFLGGSNLGNGRFLGCGYPGQNAPSRIARAHCVMAADGLGTGGLKVNSIVIDDPGASYAAAPYVQLLNDGNDPLGCARPAAASGFDLYPGQSWYEAHSVVATESVAVFSPTTNDAYYAAYTT